MNSILDRLLNALEKSPKRRHAIILLVVGVLTSTSIFIVQHYWFGAKFAPEWSDNANIFIGPVLILVFSIIASILMLFFWSGTESIEPASQLVSGPLPVYAAEPLESFFSSTELEKLKKAYETAKDQNQITLIGFLSLSAPMQSLERSYLLGQVFFLNLCSHLIDTCNYKIQLRINPYGEWPEKDRNSSRNAKYLAATLIWALATEFKLLPRPLVSDDLTNDDYRLAKSIQGALAGFRTEFVGSGISRMPNMKTHKVYDSLLEWRLDPSKSPNQHTKSIVQNVQKYYNLRQINLTGDDVLAMFYLFFYKFPSTDQEEIAKATLSYVKLGDNSILLECEKNRYYLAAHSALAKIAGLKFPAIVYFMGVPSLGLNSLSSYMKGGAKVKESQLLSLEDLCGSQWKNKISTYLAQSQAELCKLFGIINAADTKTLDALIISIAERLRASVIRAKQIYYRTESGDA